MSELTIVVDDAKLLKTIEELASLHGTPVEAEVRALLEKAVSDYQQRLELVRRARTIRAMTPAGVKQTDAVEIIREMREERDRELGC